MQPQRIFITGASSGLGAGLAAHYGLPGTVLGLVARRLDPMRELARPLLERGARVHLYAGDVADTDWVRGQAQAFLAAAAGIDLVVANAGIGRPSTVERTDACGVARVFATNVIGVTNTVLPFIPAMLKNRKGTLVAIGSIAGFRALPGSTAYCASKAAVHAFMDGLRMDLHGSGVHAMTICPGFVRTPMTEGRRHPMPFLIDRDSAVQLIANAITVRRNTYCFPWQTHGLVQLMRHLPEALLRSLVARKSS
jgi:short-subunit dehydrogenase